MGTHSGEYGIVNQGQESIHTYTLEYREKWMRISIFISKNQ